MLVSSESQQSRGVALPSNTSPSAHKARPYVNRVCVPGLHVDGRERRERSRGWLVVVGRVWSRAAAGIVAGEEEGAAARVRV